MKTITINKTDYKIKYTIRALFIFEQITGKSFSISTILDNYIFFYSLILANNSDKNLTWDEFLDAIDNDKDLINSLNNIIKDYQNQDGMFSGDEKSDSKKK